MSHFTRDLAVARFAAVVLIEVLALGICFLPLIHCSQQWQKDCRTVGIIAAIAMLILCVLVFVAASLVPRTIDEEKFVRRLEWGITATYILNVAFLLLVIARTGGPTNSLYGTLIPIQLSAILFLQLEKDRLAGKASLGMAACYAIVGLAGYLVAHHLRMQIGSWKLLFTDDPSVVDYAKENAPWAAALTICAMLLSFLTYAVPSDERFIAKIRSWYGPESPERK